MVSSAVPSFPNLFLQLIITVFLQFSKVFPTCWCMLSFDFISFSHQFRENMERSTIFHGKIWKDPPFFMGKYGKIHHFSWENMERSTIFHGKIWKDPPFFMGNYGKIHHFSWETVSRHTWKMFYLWFFGRFEIKKPSESKCSDIFPSGICIQNVFESYNILLPMSFSNKFLDTWKDNAQYTHCNRTGTWWNPRRKGRNGENHWNPVIKWARRWGKQMKPSEKMNK